MDSDPWADSPATPRTGSPRISIELPKLEPSPDVSITTIESPKPNSPRPVSEEELEKRPSPEENASPSQDLRITSEEPAEIAVDVPKIEENDGGFDDFDDFDAPEAGPSRPSDSGAFVEATEGDGDDGFGDFGDFEEGDFDAPPSEPVAAAPAAAVPAQSWKALNLRPFPTASELLDQLSEILRPLAPPPGVLSDAPARNVGGLSQVMVAESSRDVYAQLTTAPMLKPLDWTRSRVRREHLISMGVPVNLDEVDSHRISALPPLRITTQEHLNNSKPVRRAQSMDLQNGTARASDRPGSAITARDKGKGKALGVGMNEPDSHGEKSGKYGLGGRPEMDMDKAEELCGLEEDRLSLLSLASLRKIQSDLVEISSQASSTLAWALQLKDAQSQDSATYNGMISELIANAAKAKTAQQTGSGGVFRRSSTKVKQASTTSTPRVGSPAMR